MNICAYSFWVEIKFDFKMSQDSSLPFQSRSHNGENYLFLPLEFPEAGAQRSMSPPQAGSGWYAACEWQRVEAHLLLPILISIIKLYISESAFTVKFEEYQLTGKRIKI